MTTETKISTKAFTYSLAILMASLLLTFAVSLRGSPVVVEMRLENLPMEINDMNATVDSFPDYVNKALNADKDLYRHYRAANGSQIDLYIGYYGTAKGGRTGHDPLFCMPSQGWALIDSHDIKLKSDYYPEGVSVKYLLATKDNLSMITIYWYQSSGTKVLSNGIEQNLQRFLGLVIHNRSDGAFVRITLLSDRDNARTSMLTALAFSEQILNLLPNYWPLEN
jgi:EpsI family protein